VGTKPYLRLADVTVANGVSSINSGNIVDTRPLARLGNGGRRLRHCLRIHHRQDNGVVSIGDRQ
jgi:hypothetical protein